MDLIDRIVYGDDTSVVWKPTGFYLIDSLQHDWSHLWLGSLERAARGYSINIRRIV